MKKLLVILVACLGCFGAVEAQNIWKEIYYPGVIYFLGVGPDGSIYAIPHPDYYIGCGFGCLVRSNDEGETWQTVASLENNFNTTCFTVSKEGRIFVYNDGINAAMYSDDNGDTWQQTSATPISASYDGRAKSLYAVSNDIVIGWTQSDRLFWTMDGGFTWEKTWTDIPALYDYYSISDLLVNENGDVFISVYLNIGPNNGIYRSSLSDMQHWELASVEGYSVRDMEFDPEGNVVCGVSWGESFSGFEQYPGFCFISAEGLGIADNGTIYKWSRTANQTAFLAYSLDHGKTFTEIGEEIPISEYDFGALHKGCDNHLYFKPYQHYYKSITNADDIGLDEEIFPIGSEWYYEIQEDNGDVTYQYLQCTGDTTVNGGKAKVIVRTNQIYDKGNQSAITHEYIITRNGVVYWWNKELQEYTVLYDFYAEVGDEWEIKVGTESLIMHVDAVEDYEYQGEKHRMLRVSDVNNLFTGDLVEGLGHTTSFFPEKLMNKNANFLVNGLRCYWLNDELIFHNDAEEDCDAIHSTIATVDETETNGFALYPNPTSGLITIRPSDFCLPSSDFRITNLLGQTLMTGTISEGTIDVSDLPKGMYFITINELSLKFVKK